MVDVARFAAGPRVRQWAHEHGVSDWMAARWLRIAHDPNGLLDGMLRRPPRYIRANTLRISARDLQRRLEGRGFEVEPSDLDPEVLRIRHAPTSPGATFEHLLGMSTMQDVASAAAPLALDARRGDTVADLAAAPGIKTIHVAGDMQDQGAVVAIEPSAARMRALEANLERCGVTCVRMRRHEAQDTPGTAWADKVLLDAPCTGEGTIPKDRARRKGRPEEIARLAALQNELADAADRILAPGGTLVYATCTYAPEENEAQVQRLVDRGYRIERLPFQRCGGVPLEPGVTEWPGLELDPEMRHTRRFLPGRHPSYGFYVAKLRKGDA